MRNIFQNQKKTLFFLKNNNKLHYTIILADM